MKRALALLTASYMTEASRSPGLNCWFSPTLTLHMQLERQVSAPWPCRTGKQSEANSYPCYFQVVFLCSVEVLG